MREEGLLGSERLRHTKLLVAAREGRARLGAGQLICRGVHKPLKMLSSMDEDKFKGKNPANLNSLDEII